MSDSLTDIHQLIATGKSFTFENFSTKSRSGYPNAYSEDWLVWTHRVNEVVREIGQSTIANSIARGLGIELLGNDQDDVEAAKNLIVSGLQAAARIFSPDIPASDRVVTIGDNSREQKEALKKIDALIEAVQQTNDYPGTPEEKQQTISELSAAHKLFEAATVRVAAVSAVLKPKLIWLAEKFAGAIVGKLAGDFLSYLAGFTFFSIEAPVNCWRSFPLKFALGAS
jgi:hypothetical protein